MTKFVGNRASIGIAKETSRGTAESSATYWLPHMSLTMDDTIEQAIDDSAYGVIEDAVNAELTKKVAVGEFEGKIGVDSIGLLFLALFGSVSTSGPTDSAYTHTFSIQQSAQHQALSLFVDEPNQDYKHALGMITNVALNVVLGAYATIRVGFRAKAGATASLTPSFSEETTFLPQHGTFKTASTQSGLSGASAVNIRSLSLNFEKNVEDDDVIGSDEPDDILNKTFMATGTVELVYNSGDFKTEMLADTGEAMRITLANTGVTIGASTTPTVQIDFHRVKYNAVERVFENGQIVVVRASFKAFYKTADSKMITAVVTNDVSSY